MNLFAHRGTVHPAETGWAVQALRRSRERMEAAGEHAATVFAATGEALMWIVLLDDWYSREHAEEYKEMKTGMKSLLRGLRWARNRALHDFALLTGVVSRRWSDEILHAGWQHPQDVLPSVDPRHDEGAKQYDARVAGRRLLDPVKEALDWFAGWVEPGLKPPTA